MIEGDAVVHEIEPRPGGRFRFEIEPGQFCEGEYVEVDPPHSLELTWGWTEPFFDLPPGASRVRVELAPTAAGGTRLRLVHDRLPGEYPTGDPAERARALSEQGRPA